MTSNNDSSLSTNQLADKIINAKKKLRQTESATTPTSNPGDSLSDIPERQLYWLWEKRILRGKLTLLDADPGLGKSLITLDLAWHRWMMGGPSILVSDCSPSPWVTVPHQLHQAE